MTTTTTTHPPSALPVDLWFAGSFMRVHADAQSTGGQFAMIEQRCARGFSPPTHVHSNEDQLVYVVEGAITARLGDLERHVGAGESVWMPRDTPHTFRVETDEARLIEVTTPGGFERYHVELGEPATQPRIPDPAPMDVGSLAAASANYGCQIIGPPMTF